MRLSIVIPVWNDPAGLSRLLGDIAGLGVAEEVIVVDDASEPPCTAAACLPPGGLGGARLLWRRLEAAGGAGRARNAGLDAAGCPHVMFVDADDRLLPELGPLLADLDGQDFDFAIFRHADSRAVALGSHGPLEPDATLWRRVAAGVAPRPLAGAEARLLCRIAAYPWNKVYRTGFLRGEAIRFTEIPVHNDLALHWACFIAAGRVLASDRICCLHQVTDDGQHLTHRRDSDRLRVFEALDEVALRLRAAADAGLFAEPFVEFCLRLFDWIPARLDSPAARAEFALRAGRFLAALGADFLTLALLRNPGLAAPAIARLRAAA